MTASRGRRHASAAAGASAIAAPTKHITALPPRLGSGSGNACPAIAPGAAAKAGQ